MATDLRPDENAAITPPPGAGADLQPDQNAPVTPPSGTARRLGDAGLALAKGVIGVPEAAVGVADLVSGGRAGKFLENKDGAFGFRPREAKEFLDTLKSPEQQAADRNVQQAEGFIPTVGAMVQNPSTIVGAAAESAPSMIGGAGVARGAMAALPRLGAIGAGAIGEGVVSAGQNAEQVRQEDPNGTLTAGQSAVLAASGALTGGISFGAGRVANRLGLGDVNTMLAQGRAGTVGAEASAAGANKGLLRKIGEGFATEGALQELPQSAQEQVAQNIAQGKPWDEGVGAAAAQGLLVGGLTGAIAGPLGGEGHPVAPPTSPISRSLGLPPPSTAGGTILVGPDGAAITPVQQSAQESERVLAEQSNPAPRSVDGLLERGRLGQAYPVTDVTPKGPIASAIAAAPAGVPLLPPAPEPTTVQLAQEYAEADDADRKVYDQIFGSDVQDVEAKGPNPLDSLLDANIQWDTPNIDTPTAMRAMGFTEDEVNDALAHESRRQAEGGSRRGSTAEPAAAATSPAPGPAQDAAGQQTQKEGVDREPKEQAPRAPRVATGAPVAAAPPSATNVSPLPNNGRNRQQDVAKLPGDVSLVEHVTSKGKTLRGVIRKGMTLAEAKAIDSGSFMKGGGAFIRERSLDKLAEFDAQKGTPAPPAAAKAPASTTRRAAAPVEDTTPKAQWTRTTTADRLGMLNRAGRTGLLSQRLARTAWDDLQPATQKLLASAIQGDTDGSNVLGAAGRGTEPAAGAGAGGAGAGTADAAGALAPVAGPDGGDGAGRPVRRGGDADAGARGGENARPVADRAQRPAAGGVAGADGVRIDTAPSPDDRVGAAGRASGAADADAAANPSGAPGVATKPNTIFTEDAAAAARARMKAKLNRPMSGIDPELLQDGITLAGYHIEKGARTFAAYTRAMLDDMGENIRPYLKQLYMAVKFDPRATALDGMDGAGAVESADVDAIEATPAAEPAPASAPPAPGPVASAPATPLYSQMRVAPESVEQLTKWASSQGFRSIVDDMHVTVGYSSTPVDASAVPLAPAVTIGDSRARTVQPLGREGAVVLMLGSESSRTQPLAAAHQALRDAGASWDFPSYEPHITITYSGQGVDLSKVEPYRGPISLMAEERSPIESSRETTETPAPAADGTLASTFYNAIAAGQMPANNLALKRMLSEFDGKAPDQVRLKEGQEALEAAIARTARDVMAQKEGPRTTFDVLRRLYESQPNLNVRTSTSIANQAYSTPAPLAFLASELAHIEPGQSVLEPTAGTGMLLIGATPSKASVNELNPDRAALLREQGFRVSEKDAATEQLRHAGYPVDAVIANPPFGSIKDANGSTVKVRVDGYKIGQIDHLIAARALETMKDDGRATLIIGANKVAGGQNTDDTVFFNWLYGHYNVADQFEVSGDLYARQGAGWPVRVITINGRQQSARTAPAPGTIPRANTWEQVYERFTASLDASRAGPVAGAGSGAVGAGAGEAGAGPVPAAAGRQAATPGGRGPGSGTPGAGNVAGAGARALPDRGGSAAGPVGAGFDVQRINAEPVQPSRMELARDSGASPAAEPARDPGAAALTNEENQFQANYVPRSSRKDAGVLIPVNMQQPTQDALSRLEDAVGDIDQYAAKELGYPSVKALHDAFMGLQVDSVASAIYQIDQKDKGVIIADQTGIGKGRQAAAIIRWAARKGYVPVFVSVKPSLFTDMYGDLADIGTNDVQPFIMNSDAWVSGPDGEKLFANKVGHRRLIEQIRDTGELPAGSNAVFMTYSQINVENAQRGALTALAPRAVFVLDESHNAGGESNTGEYITSVLDGAKGVTYLSATYAKRPDNMPLYFKTDIGQAAADNEGLMSAMAAGGLPLQTVVSNNLVKAGQMFRRERSYDGVNIDAATDTENRVEHEKLSDTTTLALRAIVDADRSFHEIYVKELDKQMRAEGQRVIDGAGNQVQAGVQHTEFSSVVHNFVKQMLLGLKAQNAADRAVAALKRGEKPIIAVENTMGSFLTEYAAANGVAQGDSLGRFDYRTVLSRALERSRVLIEQKASGDKVKRAVRLDQLDPLTRKAYDDAQRVIDGLNISIPVSPIDWMRSQIQKAGYSVAEITGRNLSVDYADPRRPVLSAIDQQEQRDKVATTRRFNAGDLDAIILNVAGSTGISLHASEKFADKRQRHMIVAQPASDINIFMQMLGRIHRTGQVVLPKYTLLSADLPTERRPTALLSKKMKSLNANTSSNTESATSVKTADMLNKYGDQVVGQYLADNYPLSRALGIDTPMGENGPMEDVARKATGRLALQPVKVQQAFYDEVEGQYNALLDYLNKTNQNDLEPRTFDFDARETRQDVLFEGPDKNSPFGDDAIYGEYSIKAQGKPMSPAEIKASITEHLGGKDSDAHVRGIIEPLNAQYQAYRQGLDEAQHDPADAVMRMGRQFLIDHAIGKAFRVDINGDPFNAVVTNIRSTHKAGGNPFSMSKIQVSIAVNGALRNVTVPATQFQRIEQSAIQRGFSIDQLFKEGPPNQRETAKIVTGNLLAAYGELKGVRGTIVSFTKQDGTIEQGILLPKAFDFGKNTRGDYRLHTGAEALKFLQESENGDIGRFGIMSRDSVVRVLPNEKGIRVQVPKSKLRGGKYFLDKGLIEQLGDFVTSGNTMAAETTDPKKATAALDLLMKKQALYALPSMAEEARAITGAGTTSLSIEPQVLRGAALASWFNGSQVTNPDGTPKVVFHGTTSNFTEFSNEFIGEGDGNADWGDGFYFTDRAAAANNYAEGEGGNVLPVYLNIKNPANNAVMQSAEVQDALDDGMGFQEVKDVLAERGYDGIAITHKDGAVEYVVFEPTQIKSATGNRGTFDPANPDITLSPELDVENPAPTATRDGIPTRPASATQQAKLKVLSAHLARQFGSVFDPATLVAVEPNGVGGVLGQSLQAVRSTASRLFGHDVVFVRFTDGNPLFNGSASTAINGTVFIRIDASRPHMAILGHELLHNLRTADPALYRVLNQRLERLYKAGAKGDYFDKIRASYAAKGLAVPTSWSEELTADIVGDHFMEPKFWTDLAAQGEPGQFRLLVNAILKFIDRLAALMTGSKPFGTDQYLSDLAAARAAVVQAMQQFSADQLANPGRPAVPSARDEDAGGALLSIASDPGRLMGAAREGVATFMNTPGKVNWWHNTVGTPYNLAQKNPAFKRVFDRVQDFIKDVSAYATEAADLAPRILPQLNTLGDLKKAPLSAADTKAVSRATFEGTLTWARDERGQPIKMAALEARYAGFDAEQKARLMLRQGLVSETELKRWQGLPIDSYEGAVRNRFEATVLKPGVVWKPAELKSMFGFDDRQVSLYQEGRKALDKSITDLALSDMVRYAGKDGAAIASMVMDSGDVVAGSQLMRDHLLDLGQADPARSQILMDTANKVIEKSDRAVDLMERGYAPLSRFGTYSLDVVDANGERAYFGLFESRLERAAMAKKMAAEFPGAKITQGTVSQESHKLFAGVTPETLELFGEMLGLESQGDDAGHQAFQQYLKLAKGNRSAMKRLIERKGIAGFDEDFGRVLAGFITSNARQISGNLNTGAIQEATADISQREGEIKDAAIKLATYASNPQEEAGAFRGLLFAQYIGGSIASAMVNMTQPLQTTLPYLSQFGGVAKAAKNVRRAAADALKKGSTGDASLDRALKMADERGITLPQEIHQLQGQAMGNAQLQSGDGTRLGDARAIANNSLSRLQLGWGKLFSVAESYNRRLTFIAAYRTAQEQGVSSPFAFAEKAVAETQFVANKGNRPRWARGAVGATLFTFKSYSVNYIELLGRMATAGEPGSPERAAGQRAAALALATLFLMGGAGGLPFAEDLGDLIDGLMQRLGFNFNTKQKRQEFLEGIFGQAGAQFVERGVSGIAGVPVDLSGRLGMGNLLPGTGFLTKKADYGRDTAELFGPAGDFVKRAGTGVGQLVEGDVKDAVFSMAPKAVGNLRQGLDMATTGMYRDAKGKKVIDTNGYEALSKAIGFQPASVAQVQGATFTQQNMIAQNRMQASEITDKWAAGIAQRDPAMIREAQEELKQWNVRNPESPIRPNLASIQKKAQTLNLDKAARIEKTAPKALRAEVRENIAREMAR